MAAVPSPPRRTTVPSGPSRPAGSVVDLLAAARRELAEATVATTPSIRYAAAHLAALRAAAAVIAARAKPSAPGSKSASRPVSAWALLVAVAPEMQEWATFFAAGAAKRAAAEAGLPAATAREADDLLRDAETFLAVVETKVGWCSQAALPLRATS